MRSPTPERMQQGEKEEEDDFFPATGKKLWRVAATDNKTIDEQPRVT